MAGRNHAKAAVWAVVAVGLLARLAIVLISEDRLNEDVDAYLAIGRAVWQTGTFGAGGPTAFRPPLYPILIAPAAADSLWWARGLLNVLAGGATLGLTASLARLLGVAAWAAAGLVAASPIAVWYCGYSMTEVLCGLLLLASGLSVLRARDSTRWAAAAGVLLGLASLCRPTGYVVAAGWAAWLLWRGERRRVAALCVAAAVTVAPWAARNLVQFGRPILTTTHGGYTLLLGNNDAFYDAVLPRPWGAVWGAGQADWVRGLEAEMTGVEGELPRDAWMKRRAWRTIRERPGDFLRAALLRAGRFWNVVPQGPAADRLPSFAYYGVGAFYAACWAAAAVGAVRLWRTRPEAAVFLLVPLAAFTAVHLLYWANARMRVPVEPFAMTLAAAGLVFRRNAGRG